MQNTVFQQHNNKKSQMLYFTDNQFICVFVARKQRTIE